MLSTWKLVLLLVPVGCIAAMLLFMLARRWWRGRLLRRRDQLRRWWLEQIPPLLAGRRIDPSWLQRREQRETFEQLVLDRLETAASEEAERWRGLLERAGFLDRHLDWLRRGNHWQRLESAALLGRSGAKQALPALLALVRDPASELRNAAARALAAVGDPGVAPALMEWARAPELPITPNSWLHVAVACRVAPLSLLPLLADDRAPVRAMAARVLAELPDPPRFDAVQQFAFDPDDEVRAQMARLLGRTRDSRAGQLLAALAQDEQWFVRLRALAGLGEAVWPECLDAVLRGTRDAHFQVRARAAQTLVGMAARPAVVLRCLLSAGDRYALDAYLSLLGRSGLLWRSLALLRSPSLEERADAYCLLAAALRAGAQQDLLYALETHPDLRIRLKVARLLADQRTPGLLPLLEQMQTRVAGRRSRRILKALILTLRSVEAEGGGPPASRDRAGAGQRREAHALADRV